MNAGQLYIFLAGVANGNSIDYNRKVSSLLHHLNKPGWYDYGFRDYDSRTGRFTTVAPIRDGMNWYAYCGGDPINFVDLWGLSASDKPTTGPGAEFDSIESAAMDWANNYAAESIAINKELGSFIYGYESAGDVKSSYTTPTVGDEHNVTVTANLQEGQEVVSMIHSHGANDPKYNDHRPSQTDIDGVGESYETFYNHVGYEYLVTPQGNLIKYDYNGNKEIISSDLPKDPNL